MSSPTTTERTNDRKTLWVFTPSRTDPKDLEFILVQRQKLLQDAVERVKESATTDHKHHLLFVGPRGCGKTHFVTLVVSRLSHDDELTDRLRIAWLNEDETCTTLLELLLKIFAALGKRYPAEYREEMLAPAFDLKQDAALEFVAGRLLAALGSRTLLVVTENLDAIFDGLGDAGQKRLRSFLQENPRLSIVATAQRLVADLSDRARPFFGFFQTEHLKPLNVEQATELLQNIARLQEEGGVADFLSTSRGRSRVRAIHHLSGGNHRIYIVLSQFITRDSVDALLEPFTRMVDELTPYYQERIRWLPPLQRKIVELLCACEGTVPVKEIARRLFSTPQTISSQLQDLREKGYVQAKQRGREFLYEVSEPLMRLCVEVKDNQRHQPLRLLVDFLRVWYEDSELKHRLGRMEPASAARPYLESAIYLNRVDDGLTGQILCEDSQWSVPERLPRSGRHRIVRARNDAPEAVLLALQSRLEGKSIEAVRCLDNAIAADPTSAGRVELLMLRGELHSALGDRGKAIGDYASVTGLCGAPVDRVADAHAALAGLHFSDGRWIEGLRSLEAALACGATAQPTYRPNATELVGIVFSAGLSPKGRRGRVRELLSAYGKQAALSVLGEGLVQHIGGVFRDGEPFPSADNLEGWASSWERESDGVPDFRLSARLLRTAVDYVKAGGKDPGALLSLTSPERAILEQALGLEEKDDGKPL